MEGEKEADATKRQQTNEQRQARQWAALGAGGGVAGHKVAKTKGSNVVVPPTLPNLPRCSTAFSPNEQKLQINLLLLLAILCSAGGRGWRRRQRTLLLIR